MKLYEINQEIQALMLEIEPDPETGEIPWNEDEIIDRINTLIMEREDILQYLAKLILNVRGDIGTLKAEEDRLKKRRQALEKKEERILKILDRECCGQTTDLGVATFKYTSSKVLEVTDEDKAVRWLKRHKFTNAIKVVAPTVIKTEVKKLISSGKEVPGCSIRENRPYSLK